MLIILLFVFVFGKDSGNLDFGVLVNHLTPETFDEWVGNVDVALIEFYAPWCGHCKKSLPEIKKASKILGQSSQQAIGVVNCDIQKSLCHKFGVKGFPTIKLFGKGEFVMDYSGSRAAKNFVEFLDQNSIGEVEYIENQNELLEALKEQKKHIFFGVFQDFDSEEFKIFERAKGKIFGVQFIAYVAGPNPMEKFFAVDGSTVVYFETGKTYSISKEKKILEVDLEDVKTTKKMTNPPFKRVFNKEELKSVQESGNDVILALLSTEDDLKGWVGEIAEELAFEFGDQYSVIHQLLTLPSEEGGLYDRWSLPSGPALVAWGFERKVKWVKFDQLENLKETFKWVRQLFQKPFYFASEDIPEKTKSPSDPSILQIEKVVRNNFEESVLDVVLGNEPIDIVICMFHSDMEEGQKFLNDEYPQLVNSINEVLKSSSTKHLKFLSFDRLKNDLPATSYISFLGTLPTLFIYNHKKDAHPIRYQWTFDLNEMMKYLIGNLESLGEEDRNKMKSLVGSFPQNEFYDGYNEQISRRRIEPVYDENGKEVRDEDQSSGRRGMKRTGGGGGGGSQCGGGGRRKERPEAGGRRRGRTEGGRTGRPTEDGRRRGAEAHGTRRSGGKKRTRKEVVEDLNAARINVMNLSKELAQMDGDNDKWKELEEQWKEMKKTTGEKSEQIPNTDSTDSKMNPEIVKSKIEEIKEKRMDEDSNPEFVADEL